MKLDLATFVIAARRQGLLPAGPVSLADALAVTLVGADIDMVSVPEATLIDVRLAYNGHAVLAIVK